jgi:hypothetical protein
MPRYLVTMASGAVVEFDAKRLQVDREGAGNSISAFLWESEDDGADLIYVNPMRVEAVVKLNSAPAHATAGIGNAISELFQANLDKELARAKSGETRLGKLGNRGRS